jgi:hypothetical protein
VKHDFRKRGIELVKGVINLSLLSNIKGSHCRLLSGALVRVAFGADGTGRCLWLRFGLASRLLLTSFLVPGLSAVGDLRQQGPDPLNIFLTPGSYLVPTDNLCLGRGYLSILNVTGESGHADTEFVGSLARGVARH